MNHASEEPSDADADRPVALDDPVVDQRIVSDDPGFRDANRALKKTLANLKGCSEAEREALLDSFGRIEQMIKKLETGRVEIAVFGEISTGKSALINALIGREVTSVDVRGGWTKEVWGVAWDGVGYRLPGLGTSELVLVDTPGLNEVRGAGRGEMAVEAVARADIVLFVSDSDLNDVEWNALLEIVSASKPVLFVLNKVDLYSPKQLERLIETLRDDRLKELIAPEDFLLCSADPREKEYVIQAADGSERSEWRKPQPQIVDLKRRILEILEREGKALIAVNAAMYASDHDDLITATKVRLRETRANGAIWSCAVTKGAAVAFNPVPGVDILAGVGVDATMIVWLSRIYGLPMNLKNAQKLVASLSVAVGAVTASEIASHVAIGLLKATTLGWVTPFTAAPQGAIAAFSSYIVGQAAKEYFEHGGDWGAEGPKATVRRILQQTDRAGVLSRLKKEILAKVDRNRHARPATGFFGEKIEEKK
jgi:small GTP-binding protein